VRHSRRTTTALERFGEDALESSAARATPYAPSSLDVRSTPFALVACVPIRQRSSASTAVTFDRHSVD